MNKTKLEVIRINEDVIATSGCSHDGAQHIKITDNKSSGPLPGAPGEVFAKLYLKNSYQGTPDSIQSETSFKNWDDVEIGKWFYWDGSKYQLCDGDEKHHLYD